MTISTIDSSYAMNYQKKDLNRVKVLEKEENLSSKVEDIKENRNLDNEELRKLFYLNKASEIMKSLLSSRLEEKDLTYIDVRELQKLENRLDILEYYKNEVRIEKNESKYEMWV